MFGKRLFGLPAFGDVRDEALEGLEVAVFGEYADALFPDPPLVAGGGMDAVRNEEGLAAAERRLNLIPDALAVVRVHDVVVGELAVEKQVFRVVAGQPAAAAAYELHRPVAVVLASVGHAGQVAQKGVHHALAFPQRLLRLAPLGDIDKYADAAGYPPLFVPHDLRRDQGIDFSCVVGKPGHLEATRAPAALAFDLALHECATFGMHEFEYVMPDEICAAAAEYLTEAVVHPGEPPVGIAHAEAFVHRLDKRAVTLFAVLEGPLGGHAGALGLEAARDDDGNQNRGHRGYGDGRKRYIPGQRRHLATDVVEVYSRAHYPTPRFEEDRVRELRRQALWIVLPLPHVLHITRPVPRGRPDDVAEEIASVGPLVVGNVAALEIAPVGVHYHVVIGGEYPEIVLVLRAVAKAAEVVGGGHLRLGEGHRSLPCLLGEILYVGHRGAGKLLYHFTLAIEYVFSAVGKYECEEGDHEKRDYRDGRQECAEAEGPPEFRIYLHCRLRLPKGSPRRLARPPFHILPPRCHMSIVFADCRALECFRNFEKMTINELE